MVAPAFIDSQTRDFAGAQALTFDMGTITHTTGDFLIAFVKQSENTGAQVWDDDGGGGNGWVREAYNRTTGGRDQETAVYWKIATSAAEPDPTFTWNTGGTNEQMSGSVLVYRGVDQATPFTELTFRQAQNDANPPNPTVRIDNIDTRVVVFHASTHDDISAVAAPTGFTLRTQVWNGLADDHRNHFTADLEVDTIGDYAPPDWQHTVLNTTPEYHTYSIALNETQPIGITASPNLVANDSTNQTITGFGFGAIQGTGMVELWSDLVGTIKIAQSVDTWSDVSIQFDIAAGALSDSTGYLVVTSDAGDVSSAKFIAIGFVYAPNAQVDFDHFWSMQNTTEDSGAQGSNPFGVVNRGGPPEFVTTPVIKGQTHALQHSDIADGTEIADSAFTNITNQHQARNVGGWIHLDSYQLQPASVYEEGGGVNNFYFIVGFGNILLANVADSNGAPDFKIQAYSDRPLLPGRWYHIMLAFSGTNHDDEFIVYVDGVRQAVTSGNPVGNPDMSTHSGDWSFGNPDGNLDTGGTDIGYSSCSVMSLSHWGTTSAIGGGALIAPLVIRERLFEDGAPEEHTILSDTEANMQAAVTALDGQTHSSLFGMTYQFAGPTGGGDLTVTLTDQVFADDISCHLRWLGTGTLTIRNAGTSNASISSTPLGGTVVFVQVVDVTVTAVELATNLVRPNAMVRVLADIGGPLAAGTELLRAFTDGTGMVMFSLDYTADQPVIGDVRHGTTSPYLKSTAILGTVTVDGLDLSAPMLPDE